MKVEGKTSGRSPRRVVLAFVFVLLLAGLGFGILAWRNPLWLVDQQIDARLRLRGVHSEFVTVNGYNMHYLVGGTGRPLVLVHGLGSRGADWANLIPRLIDGGHRVYALDLLGYGRSAQPRDASYSISDQALMVEGFLNSQHLRQVDLAGWSMGGWIAMRVALQQPERIRRLVLLDSAGLRFKLGFDPALFQPASPTDLAQLEELLVPHPRPLPGFLAMAMLRRGDRIGWVVHRSVESMMTGADLVDGKLGALTMPVLIGWGDQDRLIPLSVGYRLHAEILQSELDVYANCGHLAPGQCVGQVGPSVVDFLNAQPARMAMVREIPATATNDSVIPGQ
ncbi:MAG TPA: alpha/beta fold hydrolase [Acidobacteriaceae bacterium]|nr:alpha/beta fold hydrolase [Acidobacteriaceae bacterium]